MSSSVLIASHQLDVSRDVLFRADGATWEAYQEYLAALQCDMKVIEARSRYDSSDEVDA
jgi:hypothetical protein